MSPVHLDDVGHYFFFILRYWKSNGEPIATGDFVHRKTFYRKKEILFFPERICNKWKYPFVVSLRYHHQTFHFLMDFSFGVAGRIASKENIFQRGSSASIFYFISFLNCFYILHTKKTNRCREFDSKLFIAQPMRKRRLGVAQLYSTPPIWAWASIASLCLVFGGNHKMK